jgi:DMSO/TMAO reductase YedYZ molybdopterin-dependent catalytic subunit
VEQSRRLLRLQSVTEPVVPRGASLGIRGLTPWRTQPQDFYLIHTALVAPAIEPKDWSLRIHGMVDHPITLTYHDLIRRELVEDWITLNCVSNPVGGPLIGNAWWSGIKIAPLLAEVGVQAGADAVLQTSHDGWTCGTPIAALTDGRNAMLAVAMDGLPLEIDHGFPVRTVVPGLYGFVSACKWVVDWEITRFDRIDAYWTQRGWSEQAPVKIASRIDLPGDGEHVTAGSVRVGGMAWDQHIGIKAVEVALDGGAWTPATIGDAGLPDSWVQWTAVLDVAPGDHTLKVRATNRDGEVQTGALADVVPNGATGWHTIGFTAENA